MWEEKRGGGRGGVLGGGQRDAGAGGERKKDLCHPVFARLDSFISFIHTS